MTNKPVHSALLGVAVGDALGVPYEFKSSADMTKNPATGMTGYGTYGQPAGTWSDDTSLTLCLADSLLTGFDLADMASKFINWKINAFWAARGEVFDIGLTTSSAIRKLQDILEYQRFEEFKTLKYFCSEMDNGNGSLMRILPLLFYLKGREIQEQFKMIWEVSALTHGHIRAAMSCLIYLKLAEHLYTGLEKKEAYDITRKQITDFWAKMEFAEKEKAHFQNVIQSDIRKADRQKLRSGGYVIESLEASLYCFLNENDYAGTVLAAVNLGHDTDTTAAISGGLAGLYYGIENIPDEWLSSLARLEDILELSEKLHLKYV